MPSSFVFFGDIKASSQLFGLFLVDYALLSSHVFTKLRICGSNLAIRQRISQLCEYAYSCTIKFIVFSDVPAGLSCLLRIYKN